MYRFVQLRQRDVSVLPPLKCQNTFTAYFVAIQAKLSWARVA